MTIEYRTVGAEVSLDEDTDNGHIQGLAAPFNTATMIGEKPWGFREQIAPGAFTKTLREADVVLLADHDPSKPMARKSAGTLRLDEAEGGLQIDANTVDTTYALDVRKNIKAGLVRGMSFGFEVVKDAWTDDEGNPSDAQNGTNRELREVKLHEVSTVTFPAYPSTNVSARDAVTSAREARAARDDSKPYGDVEYADPKNGKYPIDTKAHVKAAWSYINMPKNAEQYPMNGVTLDSVKSKIKAAAKKFGIDISEENSEKLADEWRTALLDGSLFDEERDQATMQATSPVPEQAPEDEAGEGDETQLECCACGTLNDPQDDQCYKCGADLTADDEVERSSDIDVEVREGLRSAAALLEEADTESLPENVRQAIEIVSRAAERIGARDEQPKPDDSTSADSQDEDAALLAEILSIRSRGIELGI